MISLKGIKIRSFLKDKLFLVLQAAAIVLIALSFLFAGRKSDFADAAARSLSSHISSRLSVLDGYMKDVISQPHDQWPDVKDLPEDMVIYRYRGDTLKAWCHQFPIGEDNLDTRSLFHLAPTLGHDWVSPLTTTDTLWTYRLIGPKWYIAKYIDDASGYRVIGGLEIKSNMAAGTLNGVNKNLRLSDRFSVYPVTQTGGAEVVIDGRPMLRVNQENAQALPLVPATATTWGAIFLMIAAALIYLFTHRNLKGMAITQIWITVVMAGFYLLGRIITGTSNIFSPVLYADGSVFYSLGAILIINIYISLIIYAIYCVRIPLMCAIGRIGKRAILIWCALAALLLFVPGYAFISFKSIIKNSSICLELFKITELSQYSAYVYISYIFLLSASVLILQLLRPAIHKVLGLRLNFLSSLGKLCVVVVCAAGLVSLSAVEGLKREEGKINVWANRLAVDRNLAFELQLLATENFIAADGYIGGLIAEGRDYNILLNRVMENYMGRISQDYDVGLFIFNDNEGDPSVLAYISERFINGTRLSDASRFVYNRTPQGRAQYTGRFVYRAPGGGGTNLILTLEAKPDRDDIGYYAVLGNSYSGSVPLPRHFSYAKYINDKLTSYKGTYAYPTVLKGLFRKYDTNASDINYDGYDHFFRKVAPEELIVISRRSIGVTGYLVSGFMVSIVMVLFLNLIAIDRRRRVQFNKNYYKTTFNTVLFFSLMGTLIVLALISVFFVYGRNESNINNLMNSKISTIQALVQSDIRYYSSIENFGTPEATQMLASIGEHTKSDLTLYTPAGRVFKSTKPDVFERMFWGVRMNEDAFKNIMYENRRYFIQKESVFDKSYYAMYAPLFGGDGKVLAILCAPYTDTGLEFRTEAVYHSLFMVTLFFILLSLARIITFRFIDKMFRPLLYMGRKMESARSEGLEYIIYDRDDEISTLVRAYNLMVHDLSESSRQLARAERDKAWSEMARQVAHEIKNPLTPIKLQIQRLIMLRSRGDESWGQRFDSMAPVILESIDTLTDTANEFSTFAKLYSEEPVEINLDNLIKEQVALFDGRKGIDLQYFGLQGAVIRGPKPQITRVVVNLLTNAVQAVDESGIIHISLRLSSRDGFYEIVVEDNGPGVKDENRARLFTPNFTTKSSGTGLGLAICKNILERCGGEITYSRSFTLGGACFTVYLPISAV